MFTVVLPTYNEADNIELMLPALLALNDILSHQIHVCVVDDDSPDGTGARADAWCAHDNRVQVIHRAGKLGLGTAYIAGFHHALANGAEGVLTMDCDFSHHPRYIPAMIAKFAEADLVIGSRYVQGGGVRFPLRRKLLSATANSIARVALGVKAHDCTAGFRLYRAAVLRDIPLEQIFSNGYSFLTEMIWLVQRAGWRIAEVPIFFEDRLHGSSKISSREIFKAMYTVARLGARRILSTSLFHA